MNASLNGSTILVTRPGAQGEDLCNTIENMEGTAIAFPTIEIKPVSGLSRDRLIEDLSWSSHVIFISRHAVELSFLLVAELSEILVEKKIFAAGAGTAEVLHKHGVANVFFPSIESGSEGLLDNSELSSTAIKNKHVLIIRGKGGRELLREMLETRKAVVRYLDVYSRQIPEISSDSADSIWQQEIPDIIVVTSVKGLQNLVALTAKKFRSLLFSRKLVVMSQRIADHASNMGFTGSSVVTQEQSNDGLMLAIRKSVEQS